MPANPNPLSLIVLGAGYVGSALAVDAKARGWRVTALTRNRETAGHLESQGIRTVVAELQSRDWHPAIAPADAVVNCVSSGGGGLAGYEQSYVRGMESLLEWLVRHSGKVGGVVYTSSTSVYPQDGGAVVDESMSTEAATGTAEVLLRAEDCVRQATQRGLVQRSTVLRLAGIYGPGRHHLMDQLRAGVRPFPGRGDHRLNLVHRDDVVSGIQCALERAPVGFRLYNLADGAPARKAEVVQWLAERLGLPYPEFSGSGATGRRTHTPDRTICADRARTELGWRPRYQDFRAGYTALLGA